ncbi:MAG: hypothetical protein JXQ75_23190 [Phycisphaerae bacterium]|nr:hypothetical protein [Phycisphaerae bacterium]
MASARSVGDEASTARVSSVFDRPLQRLSVDFKVLRYSAPKGTFTEDSGLWKLVTGPLLDASMALRAADNGLRAATGRESDRVPLREFLDGIDDLRSTLDYAHPDATRHVELDLGPCETRLVVFYYGQRGALRGLDFLDARAKLRLAFEMGSVNLREVWLELAPEIEEPPGPLRWEITRETARQVPEERRHTFTEVSFAAKIPEGGFLLLGPTEEVYERRLLGRAFFVEVSQNGVDGAAKLRESIYVISPIIRSHTERRPGETARPS